MILLTQTYIIKSNKLQPDHNSLSTGERHILNINAESYIGKHRQTLS